MATLDVVRSCTSEVDLEACVAAVASGERLRLDPVRSARPGFEDDRLGVVAGFRQG